MAGVNAVADRRCQVSIWGPAFTLPVKSVSNEKEYCFPPLAASPHLTAIPDHAAAGGCGQRALSGNRKYQSRWRSGHSRSPQPETASPQPTSFWLALIYGSARGSDLSGPPGLCE
jgi:hypothetical protein